MRCPNCHGENPQGSARCQECGAPLESPAAASGEQRARTLLEQALRLSDEGQLTQAIAACKQAIAANPDSASSYSLLGILYERAGQREMAIQAYEAALRLSPEGAAQQEALRHLMTPSSAPEAETAAVRAPTPPLVAALPAGLPAPRRHSAAMWMGMVVLILVAGALLVLTIRAWRSALQLSGASPMPPGAATRAQKSRQRAPAAAAPGAPILAQPVLPAAPLPARAPQMPESGAGGFATEPLTGVEPVARPSAAITAITVPAPEALAQQPTAQREEAAPPPPQPAAAAPSTAVARARYFEGDIAGAIEVYEQIAADPARVTAQVYQDLGWLYYRAGRVSDAAAAYRRSIEHYRRQLESGGDAEAAQHGISSCEAALRVLELE